jgi:RNA polymerase sigma factor (sigma-70 family)
MDKSSSRRRGRPYVVAMVLGAALTTLAPSTALARSASDHAPAVADLSRYCTACWRNAHLPVDTWNDCTQEVLCRLLRTVPMESWPQTLRLESEEHRELVRAIDAVKKRTQRQKKWPSQPLETVADHRNHQRRDLDDERAVVGKAAEELLTPRQQRILQLSFEGWSVHEIGQKLELSPERISDEKYKAIRKLRSHLAPHA